MKKLLIAIILLATFTEVSAQVRIKDLRRHLGERTPARKYISRLKTATDYASRKTGYTWDDVKYMWEYGYTSLIGHDANGNDTLEVVKDTTSGSVIYASHKKYGKYGITEMVEDNYPGLTKVLYHYEIVHGKQSARTEWQYVSGAWLRMSGDTSIYTYVKGKYETITDLSWNLNNNAWDSIRRTKYFYTKGDTLDYRVLEEYIGTWSPKNKLKSGWKKYVDETIDNNLADSIIFYNVDTGGKWAAVNRIKNTFSNGDSDFVSIAQHMDSAGYVNDSRTTQTHLDAYGSYKSMIEVWNGKAFENSEYVYMYYDKNKFSILKEYQLWMTNKWGTDKGDKYIRTYDAKNRMTELITQYYSKDSLKYLNYNRYVFSDWGGIITQTEEGINIPEFSTYPNPVSEVLHIYAKQNFDARQAFILLLDVTGKEVLRTQFTSSLDMKNYPQGLYILSVTANGKTFARTKLIKQ